MTIVLRSTKGSNLTPNEVDGNFTDIDDRVQDLESGAVATVNQIETITLVGTQLTITMEDSSTFGPFTVPIAAFHWTGEWQALHAYSVLDLFYVLGSGTFIVLRAHTSGADFDASLLVGGDPAYQKLFPDLIAFVNLTDSPDEYAGAAEFFVRVNSTEDGVEFVEPEWSLKFFYKGIPGSSELLYREMVTFDAVIAVGDFTRGGYAFDLPTGSSVTIDINVNGVLATSIVYNDDGSVDVPSFNLVLAAGDLVEFVFQSGTDITFGNIGVALYGRRAPANVPTT